LSVLLIFLKVSFISQKDFKDTMLSFIHSSGMFLNTATASLVSAAVSKNSVRVFIKIYLETIKTNCASIVSEDTCIKGYYKPVGNMRI
jgi:hypothetical protein